MPTLTLSDLSARIYARLDGNTALYPQTQVTDSLNEAIRVLNLVTGFLQKSTNVAGNSVGNQTFYSVPTGILVPLKVQFNGSYLGMYNINEVGRQYPTWLNDTTATTGLPVSYWVPFGLAQFAIYPADGVGGNTLTVTGIQEPTLLVSGGDVISIPNEQAEALDQLAFNTLTLKETGGILKDSFESYKAFQRQVQKIKIWQSLAMPALFAPEGRQIGKT